MLVDGGGGDDGEIGRAGGGRCPRVKLGGGSVDTAAAAAAAVRSRPEAVGVAPGRRRLRGDDAQLDGVVQVDAAGDVRVDVRRVDDRQRRTDARRPAAATAAPGPGRRSTRPHDRHNQYRSNGCDALRSGR